MTNAWCLTFFGEFLNIKTLLSKPQYTTSLCKFLFPRFLFKGVINIISKVSSDQ